MKRLILVRHAKSGWNDGIKSDFDRTLTKQGNIDASEMATLIKHSVTKLDKIISSPAVRAISTAQYFANSFDVDFSDIQIDTGLYEKGVSHIKRIIASQNDSLECIMLVGHNPVLTSLTTNLTADEIPALEACSVVCIDFSISQWSEIEKTNGKLIFIEAPFLL